LNKVQNIFLYLLYKKMYSIIINFIINFVYYFFNIDESNFLLNFEKGTSLVNFCESDVLTTDYVEYFNTWSSLAISIFGLIGIFKILYTDELVNIFKKYQDITLGKEYIRTSKKNRYVLNSILVLIGLGSFYFHSELSVFAHWVDIIFISIILILSDKYLDNIIDKRRIYTYYLFGLVHLLTSIYIPSIHIFMQFLSGYFIVKKIDKTLKILEEKSKKNYDINQIYLSVVKKYNNIKIVFVTSVILWIIDYFLCKFIHPYHLHWIFHIGIGYVGYQIIDLTKYLWLVKYQIVLENQV
jgi:hypothetical protein